MPIMLTKPLVYNEPGGESRTYGAVRVRFRELNPDTKSIALEVIWGNVVGRDQWVSGGVTRSYVIENRDAHLGPGGVEVAADMAFDELAFKARTTAADELIPGDGGHSIYKGLGRVVYEWLQGKYPEIYAGTIV